MARRASFKSERRQLGPFCDTSSTRDSCNDQNSVTFVNNCGCGTPLLFYAVNGVLLGLSAHFKGPLVGGICFLDQGVCQLPTYSNCAAVEINLDRERSSIRILATPFSVPVAYVFSQGCSSSVQCFDQTCSREGLLECRARNAHVVATFCPSEKPLPLYSNPRTAPTLVPLPPSPSPSPTTSSISAVRTVSPPAAPTSFASSHLAFRLTARGDDSKNLLGAELGGSIGGAAFLLLLFIVVIYIRRHLARAAEARMPQRQIPFVVNPTWVLASPISPEAASHLSLPDRARPRTVPVVAHQMSMPNLTTQYRARMLRPRASTVGAESTRIYTGVTRDRSQSDSGMGPTRSESSLWRPRIDILGARHQQTEEGQPQSFWAE